MARWRIRLKVWVAGFSVLACLVCVAEPEAQENGVASMATISDAAPGRISLDLKGVDIVELLKILSVKMDINIVPTQEVTGRVNVFLNNVTFEDALDIILINNSLAAVKQKNIVTVMTQERYSQLYGKLYNEPRRVRTFKLENATPEDVFDALSQLKTSVGKVIADEASGTIILLDIPEALTLMEKTIRILDAPKDVEIFDLRYAKAEDLQNQLKDVMTPGASKMQFDTRTNKLAIADLPEKMKNIKKMITAFDEETRQVLIEAQIVQISLNDRTQVGVNWEQVFNFIKEIKFEGTFPVTGDNTPLGRVQQVSLGTFDSDRLAFVLQYLNTFSKANILSRPKIAVINNEEASILIGSKEVYFSQTQSQGADTTTTAEQVNFVDVGVKLNVTPTITSDGYVLLKIRPEVSSVREFATSPLGSTVPIIETSEAETMVKVKDGAMIMIAGLMKEERRKTADSTPYLSKLPLIGWLFSNKDDEVQKTELAVFLTPKIISGDVERLDAEEEVVKERGILTKSPKGRME